MDIVKFTEREDGGADLELDLSPEETRFLIEVGLAKLIMDGIKIHEEQFEDDDRSWKGVDL